MPCQLPTRRACFRNVSCSLLELCWMYQHVGCWWYLLIGMSEADPPPPHHYASSHILPMMQPLLFSPVCPGLCLPRLSDVVPGLYTRLQTVWSLPGHSRQSNKGHSPRCHPSPLVDSLIRSSNLPHSLQRGVRVCTFISVYDWSRLAAGTVPGLYSRAAGRGRVDHAPLPADLSTRRYRLPTALSIRRCRCRQIDPTPDVLGRCVVCHALQEHCMLTADC